MSDNPHLKNSLNKLDMQFFIFGIPSMVCINNVTLVIIVIKNPT